MAWKPARADAHLDHPSTTIQLFRQRLHSLYRAGHTLAQEQPLLRTIFAELASLLELLETRDKEYQRQRNEWLDDRAQLEAAVDSAQTFFALAPLPYLVTSLDGTIRQANTAAATLLETAESRLIGRSLAVFMPDGQRDTLHTRVKVLLDAHDIQTWSMVVRPRPRAMVHVMVAVLVVRSRNGKPQSLRWQLYPSGSSYKQNLLG